MARPRRRGVILAATAIAAIGLGAHFLGGRSPPSPVELGRRLQQRLDRRGGLVFLPRLAGGRCYQSRGFWVSHSDTTIASNGACLTVTGAGAVRMRSADGDPIGASAAFFISRSSPVAPPPERITIRGLRIHVLADGIDGIDVYARHVSISQVRVDGTPFDDVYIGGRTNLIRSSSDVSLTGSTLLDADRNVVSITAATNVRISHDTIAGAGIRTGPAADPGDGIDVEPNSPSDPIVALGITHSEIVGNVHEGIALRLLPRGTLTARADRIAIVANTIVGNNPIGGGPQLILSGGQADHPGRILIADNRFPRDGSRGVATYTRAMRLTLAYNSRG